MKRIEKYPLVYVKWIDAQSHDEWQTLSEFKLHLKPVHSVGFLIREVEEGISLAMNLGEDDDTVAMILDIPIHWIELVDYLD